MRLYNFCSFDCYAFVYFPSSLTEFTPKIKNISILSSSFLPQKIIHPRIKILLLFSKYNWWGQSAKYKEYH